MRTTLTLDPDVARQLKARAAAEELPLKEVVNRALRIGLNAVEKPPAKKFQVEPHSFQFKPGIDLDKLNQLVDELEVDEFVRKHVR